MQVEPIVISQCHWHLHRFGSNAMDEILYCTLLSLATWCIAASFHHSFGLSSMFVLEYVRKIQWQFLTFIWSFPGLLICRVWGWWWPVEMIKVPHHAPTSPHYYVQGFNIEALSSRVLCTSYKLVFPYILFSFHRSMKEVTGEGGRVGLERN